MYDSGIIKEHSIGFQYIESKSNWIDYEDEKNVDYTEEGKDYLDRNKGYNEINEVKLWEGSYVTFGSNSSTPSFGVIKSIEDQEKYLTEVNQRMSLVRKEISNGTYSDRGFKILSQELAFIQEQYNSLLIKEPVLKTTQNKKAESEEKLREFLLFTLPNIN
jgi:hypothetical protein